MRFIALTVSSSFFFLLPRLNSQSEFSVLELREFALSQSPVVKFRPIVQQTLEIVQPVGLQFAKGDKHRSLHLLPSKHSLTTLTPARP